MYINDIFSRFINACLIIGYHLATSKGCFLVNFHPQSLSLFEWGAGSNQKMKNVTWGREGKKAIFGVTYFLHGPWVMELILYSFLALSAGIF